MITTYKYKTKKGNNKEIFDTRGYVTLKEMVILYMNTNFRNYGCKITRN